MKGSRSSKRFIKALALAGAAFSLCVAAAQAQDIPAPPVPVKVKADPVEVPVPLPDPPPPVEKTGDGNSADQSVGVVQVGPATVDPAEIVSDSPAPVGEAVAGASATVGSQGGNHASQSGGVVQAGGNNSATRSVGAAQVSHSHGSTSASHKGTAGTKADVTVGGDGATSSRGSVGSVQVGSGNSTNGSTGAIAIQPTSGTVTVSTKAGPSASQTVSVSGGQVLGDTLGVDLSSLNTVPASATLYVLDLVDSLRPAGLTAPGVSSDVALQQLVDSGVLAIGEDGDDVRLDAGTLTLQVVSLSRNPQLSMDVLGTTFSVGALAGVPNNGVPSSTDSFGVAQAG